MLGKFGFWRRKCKGILENNEIATITVKTDLLLQILIDLRVGITFLTLFHMIFICFIMLKIK